MNVRIKVRHQVEDIQKTTRRTIERVIRQTANYIYTDLVANFLSGQKLKVRSGTLRRSVRPFFKKKDRIYYAGAVFGVRYAKTHIGPKGTYEEIKPKRAKFLAIPTEYAQTPAGVSRYSSPRELPNTFVKNGIIFQKRGKNIVPMFILKRIVRVPKRIDPEEVLSRGLEYLRSVL